ncbi:MULTISPECIES: hypothetical protein [Staphylococcus]|uniref:Uncharacterized protein n=1 Tax=Staphylococcus hominis TaxID=1290 RepID=A0A974QPK4_STAHO|nr:MULTISPECIES: hypothetical protein [Staphylococcus]MBZ6448822.1 hypothetical protein [Staphylococcus saprophyticus]MDU7694769.1 hypothetical protein [Staphylococcus sp.]OFM79755.1 hypothetical protein HMPREF2662_04975 [Staphylococcus sp. HMSC074B09]OLF24695.1 hypothetical protein BSZ10_12745 [Staphylococcus aureus]MCI2932804.1 hypothetical protein [Staphylococcus hominis]
MSALKELNQDTVHFVCDEIFNWDKRTQDSLLTAAIGKRYNDDDIFLVVDVLTSENYLKYEKDKLVDVGDARQKLKNIGYLK